MAKIGDKRRIAVVIPKYGLVGGAEQFVAEVTERCARNPVYDMHVFANRWQVLSDSVTFHKVPIITFPKFLTTLSFAYFANRLAAAQPFDLIHAQDRIFDADLFTMHGVPHAFWIRHIRRKSMSLHDRATVYVEKRLMGNPRCRCYMPVSHLAAEKVLDAYDIDTETVRVVHPGIDKERFLSVDRAACREDLCRRFDIDPGARIVLFVSMNFEIKGLDRIMQAVAAAQKHDPSHPIMLVIAGKGDERKYRRLAADKGIADRVFFTGVWKDRLERLYAAGDLFMMLSRFDTFGITVLEAMAASLPVIISTHVGARDMVTNGVNGFVIGDDEDTETVAAKIGESLREETWTAMGTAARETAANHSWDTVAETIEELYRTYMRR